MKSWICGCSIVVLLLAAPIALRAQSSPVKPGLWETQTSSTSTMQLPPDVEAKLAAMPAAQQAQMRAMMPAGMGGAGTPVSTTRQVCISPQTTVDSMMNRAQQSPGMSCAVSNKTQTASGMSFDITCTGTTGNAKGHTDVHTTDDDNVTSTSHITIAATAQGHSMNSTVDTTTTAKFVSADCGDVKPWTPPPAK
jgi:hypothetical protein